MKRLLVLLPLLVASTQARAHSAPAQDELEQLVERLGDASDPQGRYAAYQQLRVRKSAELVPLLVRRLPDFDEYAQSLGVSLLQSFPLDVSVPALRKLVAAKPPFLQLLAAVALHRYREPGMLPRLVRILEEARAGSSELRRSLVQRLAYLKEPELTAVVRGYLHAEITPLELDAVLYYLSTVDDTEAALPLRELCRAGAFSAAARAIAEAYLLTRGDTEAAAWLVPHLRTASSVELGQLGKYLQRADHVPVALLDVLTERLADAQDLASRTVILRILGAQRHQPARSAIAALLEDANDSVARAAFDALGQLGGATDAELLHRILSRGSEALRLRAAEALRRLDDMTGAAHVRELAGRAGPQRAEAVRVLGGFVLRESVPVLLDALGAPELDVRTAASTALTQVWRGLLPYRRTALAQAGYDVQGPAAARQEAIARLRSWWEGLGR